MDDKQERTENNLYCHAWRNPNLKWGLNQINLEHATVGMLIFWDYSSVDPDISHIILMSMLWNTCTLNLLNLIISRHRTHKMPIWWKKTSQIQCKAPRHINIFLVIYITYCRTSSLAVLNWFHMFQMCMKEHYTVKMGSKFLPFMQSLVLKNTCI